MGRMSRWRVFMIEKRWGPTGSERESRTWRGRAEAEGAGKNHAKLQAWMPGERGRLEVLLSRAEAWLMVGSLVPSPALF